MFIINHFKLKNIISFFGILITSISLNAQCQLFQNNLVELGINSHYKDVNTIELQDGTNDIIIAGTKFTNGFNSEQLFIVRVEAIDGSRVWSYQYIDVDTSRGFDMIRFQENGQERIAVTGFVNEGQLNKMYIAIIDPLNGDILNDDSYEIDPNYNSQGLNIIYTEKNYNAIPTPGLVVVGYYNQNYDVNIANNSSGFVMRTDLNLNPLWTKSSFSQTTATVDFDMMNDITETNDGYFITGSLNEANGSRQGILLVKLDEQGDTLWTNSYVQGNYRDVGVDSYYDGLTNEIYLLTYYSNYHYFGVTTIDNTTGSVNLNKSWYFSNSNQLNRTGFKITPSTDSSTPDDLVVMGYEKEAQVPDPTGPVINANTVPFAVSFNRNTGVVSRANTYLIPYQDNLAYTDYFRFWDGQSPLIYHPEMGFTLSGSSCHFMVSNRSYGLNKTAIEMIKLDQNLSSYCLNDSFSITENLINFQALTVTIDPESTAVIDITLTKQNNGIERQECESGGVLAVNDNEINTLKIYPNPTSRILNVSTEKEANYVIYDLQGRHIIKKTPLLVGDNRIDVSKLITGIYFVKISSEGTTVTKKIIKH